MKKEPGKRAAAAEPPIAVAAEAPASPASEVDFPVVGIGASAGGLEALSVLLANMPTNSGMAFVIVQHLDPTHEALVTELLQRETDLVVREIVDGTRVEINHVYVIPPNRDVTILGGRLQLLVPSQPRGLRLPIDFFFASLAEEKRHNGIGVVLSGMGQDGTLGLQAIRDKGGFTLAQDPASARFNSMPLSAIRAGLVDVVCPVERLPKGLMAHLKDPDARDLGAEEKAEDMNAQGPGVNDPEGRGDLAKAIVLVRTHTGHDFSLYKRSTVGRRVERRMAVHQIDKLATYVRYLQENPQERELLFHELLIGVTGFFRDPTAWEKLASVAIPHLLTTRTTSTVLRAWVVACSTGEEAYTLAILLREAIDQHLPLGSMAVQIFATDLDRDAIDRARQGKYPGSISAEVSPERLSKYFVKDEQGGYRVCKEIRDSVIFAPHNLIMDPPFTRLDILTCRNLLIYLVADVQRKLMPVFHYTLNPGGILFLGSAETIGSSEMFRTIDTRARIFEKSGATSRRDALEFPTSFTAFRSQPREETALRDKVTNIQTLADNLLLRQYSPAAVLVNPDGDILYINGKTGRYLEPAAGKANWNIFAMAREGLGSELTVAVSRALSQTERVQVNGIQVTGDGQTLGVDITVQKLEAPDELRGSVMIVFSPASSAASLLADGPPGPAGSSAPGAGGEWRVPELEQQLRQLREQLRATQEQMQTSQEELKSTNEEMQSSNEELQSTNEELTTSREEMQSLNEELQTVNAQLQSRLDELSLANDDMKNLMNSTDLATIFLDSDLNVRRYTTETTRIFKLKPGDIGRPITDIVSSLAYPELVTDVADVLRTLVFVQKEVEAADKRWFSVKILPYRTLDNRIAGVVITMMDITVAKTLELQLRKRE